MILVAQCVSPSLSEGAFAFAIFLYTHLFADDGLFGSYEQRTVSFLYNVVMQGEGLQFLVCLSLIHILHRYFETFTEHFYALSGEYLALRKDKIIVVIASLLLLTRMKLDLLVLQSTSWSEVLSVISATIRRELS